MDSIKDPDLLAVLGKLGDEERKEISEILAGAVSKHSVYLTKRKPAERVTLENRVCVMGEREGLWQMLEGRSKEGGFVICIKRTFALQIAVYGKLLARISITKKK